MSGDWQLGDALPERKGGYTVVLQWNEAALTRLLRVAKDGYDSGYTCLIDAVRRSMAPSPLVVIDPENREQVERLIRLFWANGNDACDDVRAMQDALREFADPTPPKPDEPTGLGAVVEDAEGQRWMRICEHGGTCNSWRPFNSAASDIDTESKARKFYRDLAVVRVLSEGVTE